MFSLFFTLGYSYQTDPCIAQRAPCFSNCCYKVGGDFYEEPAANVNMDCSDGTCIVYGYQDVCDGYNKVIASEHGSCMDTCMENCNSPQSTENDFPSCNEAMGEIFDVRGTATISRSGQTINLVTGQSYCVDDIIRTDSRENTRISVRFNDGNIRFIFKNSVYSISRPQIPIYYEGVTGVIRAITDDRASTLNYDTIIGGRAVFNTGYKIHSDVIFEITSSAHKVSVLEGEVEIYDVGKGQYINSITTGEQYYLQYGINPEEGTVSTFDSSDYAEYTTDDGCCGALILFAPLFILSYVYRYR